MKAAGEGGARPAGRATREEQVALRFGGGWRGRLRRGRLWEVLGEAETGGTDGHNAGLEAGSRSWSMERDTRRRGTWGDREKGAAERREIRRENRKHRARERQTEVQGGMVSGAREEEGFGGREERAAAAGGAWAAAERAWNGAANRCTNTVVGGKMKARCHAITPCTTLHTQGALSLHPPPPLPHAPRNPHIQPPPPPSSQLSPVCAGSGPVSEQHA